MAETTFEELFVVYPNRNSALRALVKKAYEFGANVSQEQSAAMSSGLQEHALKRQRAYVDRIKAAVKRLAAKPIPDLPRSHPVQYAIDLSTPYKHFTTDKAGSQIPINEDSQSLSEKWMTFCVELALSESAGIAGSLLDFDEERAMNNIGVIEELLDEIADMDPLDMAESNVTSSSYGPSGSSKKP
jgi:hypothetical protein